MLIGGGRVRRRNDLKNFRQALNKRPNDVDRKAREHRADQWAPGWWCFRAVRVELNTHDEQVCITVNDNGRGFPFRGCYDHNSLTELKLRPASLKEGVISLGGLLAIDSTGTGARLKINLPLASPGARDAH